MGEDLILYSLFLSSSVYSLCEGNVEEMSLQKPATLKQVRDCFARLHEALDLCSSLVLTTTDDKQRLLFRAREARSEVTNVLNYTIEYRSSMSRHSPVIDSLIEELTALSTNIGDLIKINTE